MGVAFFNEKLEVFAKNLRDASNRTPVYEQIDRMDGGKYEWARIVALVGGKYRIASGLPFSWNKIYSEYGMDLLYQSQGAFPIAVGTALTGKTGKDSPYCKNEEIEAEINRFGIDYQWNWTLGELIQYILDNDAKSDKSKKQLEGLLELVQKYGIVGGNVVEIQNMTIEERLRDLVEEQSVKQIILTGAPGTGKTYSVRKYIETASSDGNQGKFVQFHPSYDYSDFVEGLRPVNLLNQASPTFVRMDGTFKEFCRNIVEDNLKYAFGEEVWLQKTPSEKYEAMESLHQLLTDANPVSEAYRFIHNEKKYFFVVDEINRADLSKVFGELMFGLEESYRGLTNRFDTQYKNLSSYRIISQKDVDGTAIREENIGQAVPLEFDCFKNGFFIPENLYFIGTMNDIDRSVDSIDFALRRRFRWVEIKANDIMIETLKSMHDDIPNIEEIADKIIAMNRVITSERYKMFGLSEAYHIGPAYFKNLSVDDGESMQSIFDGNIVSILREYTRGRKADDINGLLKACADVLGVDYHG